MQMIGQYQVIRELGRGGVGVVYLVRHTILGRDDALKILLPAYAGDAHLTRVILDDARIAAKLEHENIVTIHTVGIHERRPYFVMEHLEGEWLDQRIAKGPIDPQSAARIVRDVSRALDHAHRQGVAHLDVKPHNIYISPTGHVKLTDFGIARHFRDDQRTHHGGMVGTVAYMAPEQLDPSVGRVGATTDVYSLGVVLYEMLTGKPPYRAADNNMWAVVQQHLKAPRPRPSQANRKLGTDFDTPVVKAMGVKPRERHRSVLDLAEQVAAAANVTRVKKPSVPPAQAAATVVAALATVILAIVLARQSSIQSDIDASSTATVMGGMAAPASDTPPAFAGAEPSTSSWPIATDTPPAVITVAPTSAPTRDTLAAALSPAPATVTPSSPQFVLRPVTGLSECRVTLDWSPNDVDVYVLVCYGEGCNPTLGIYGPGRGPILWEPAKALPNRTDLKGQKGEYGWRVFHNTEAAPGVRASEVGRFTWHGDTCYERWPAGSKAPLSTPNGDR